jgi:hypothetical protein
MDSVTASTRDYAHRQLAFISTFRAQGLSEDEVAEKTGYRGAGHMRQELEQWNLPVWFVEGDSPPAAKTKKKSERERKTRSLGPAEELPPADDAAPLFRERLDKERLRHKRDVILGCIRQPGFEV